VLKRFYQKYRFLTKIEADREKKNRISKNFIEICGDGNSIELRKRRDLAIILRRINTAKNSFSCVN
jgi:hypothetical protein